MTSPMRVADREDGAFVIEHFLTPAMCHHSIALGEEMGYRPSEAAFSSGPPRAEDVRNNDRVLFDDPPLAASLYERARPLLPPQIGQGRLCRFNERFRFYRYGPGEYFEWHRDGSFVRSPDEASCLTFLIYRLTHQGMAIGSGTKHVLRTDVMYRRIA